MKRFIVITNIWGKKPNVTYGPMDYFKEEREEFDTIEETKDYIALFEGVCSTYTKPEINIKGKHITWKEGDRMWGYVVGDRNNYKIKFGGDALFNLKRNASTLRQRDYVFRGPDEVPKDYVWDDGEYEGWLQYRWGDGKNAIDYVEKQHKDYLKKIAKEFPPAQFEQEYMCCDFPEDMEDKFAKDYEREQIKLKENRW